VRSSRLLALLLVLVPAALLTANDRKLDWRMRPLAIDGPIPYFIAPGLEELGYRPEDAELVEWALEAWSRATDGVLCFYPAEGSKSLLRIYWSPVEEGRFGQMQSIPVEKRRGGEVYVRPQIDEIESRSREVAARAASDPVFRDAVVYLTLLHEIGHVLGLVHTPGTTDAMYYGGDVLAYFSTYRSRLTARADIRRSSALSPTDIARVRRLYPPSLWSKPQPAPPEQSKPSGKAGPEVSASGEAAPRGTQKPGGTQK
jgi:hypothetical protein